MTAYTPRKYTDLLKDSLLSMGTFHAGSLPTSLH